MVKSIYQHLEETDIKDIIIEVISSLFSLPVSSDYQILINIVLLFASHKITYFMVGLFYETIHTRNRLIGKFLYILVFVPVYFILRFTLFFVLLITIFVTENFITLLFTVAIFIILWIIVYSRTKIDEA